MRIELAGFNTDVQNGGNTPETLSAAYARISRDPRPIDQLRREACSEVEKARASNRKIVFQYGHGSVAEHAVFNFDILDVSRLAAEELQNFRLTSYTEKSQRYIRIGRDLIVPPDLDEELEPGFRDTASRLFDIYRLLTDRLSDSGADRETTMEDARYVLPLATSCQMGMTVNARELEHMVRRLSAHHLAEVRDISSRLLHLAIEAAPSLFLFVQPSAMDRYAHSMFPVDESSSADVRMVTADDDSSVGTLLVQRGTGVSIDEARAQWERMTDEERTGLFMESLSGLGIHDAPPRQWEFYDAQFEIDLSASAYAQLKRHRICSRMVSVYDPVLGVTLPPSIEGAGLADEFKEAVRISENGSGRLGRFYPYLLTNAHRRRVILKMNGRELYHFSRLREDQHAQWDIRRIAGSMMDLLRSRAPLTFVYSGGKSGMEDILI